MTLNIGLEVQKKIYATLNGDAALTALVEGVFDFVPQEQAYPFIRIGTATFTALETQTTTGFEGEVTIDVWSREAELGTAPVHEILTRIRDLLHNTNIWDIPDFCMINFREDFRDVVAETDTATYHGVIRFTMTLGGNAPI